MLDVVVQVYSPTAMPTRNSRGAWACGLSSEIGALVDDGAKLVEPPGDVLSKLGGGDAVHVHLRSELPQLALSLLRTRSDLDEARELDPDGVHDPALEPVRRQMPVVGGETMVIHGWTPKSRAALS